MPVNPRVRDNNVFGTTTDNPLAAGATSFNSLGLVNLSVIATKHAIITLDPLRQFGNPEIVIVTVHTAAATVATVTRGAYGTAIREHPQGTLWVHAPLDEDFIEIVTSTTRPSDPYEGQFIFETDTNKLYGYGGVDWAPRDAGGQLGFAENRTVTDQVITAGALLTGLSVPVTVGTGRRIKVTLKTNVFSNVAEDSAQYSIRMDGVDVDQYKVNRLSGTSEQGVYFAIVHSPSAGAHTYTAFGIRNTGSGIITNRSQGLQSTHLLVEDIGAA
jgi:hypothetical protein